MSTDPSFSLVDEPWLPCVFAGGSSGAVGIRDALVRAQEIKQLVTDVPTQLPPIVRMLLAVVHRALADGDDRAGPRSTAAWLDLWRAGCLPADPIDRYLEQHRGRFGLFDPEAPFMQAGGLRTAKGEGHTAALLVPYAASGNNTPLFSPERDAAPRPLDVAQVARWLLHVHAYDTAGIKTGAVGDPAAKAAGKTMGNPIGPLGMVGVVMPVGDTLWHTLMFNLLVLNDERSRSGDLPVWERDPLGPTWSPKRVGRGLCDLYTWPSRRVRLLPEAGADGRIVVRRVLVCAGDRLDPSVLHPALEPHTAWQRTDQKRNAGGAAGTASQYRPRRHNPDRQLWRGLGPILAQAAAEGEQPRFRKPYVLEQLGAYERRAALAGQRVRLLGTGISYGTQNAVIDETYADDTPMPVAVLEDPDWQLAVLGAVEATEAAVQALGNLAVNLAKAAGMSDERLERGERDRIRRHAYAALDGPFRTWLANLPPDGDPYDFELDWVNTARRMVFAIAEERLDSVSPAAIRGHRVKIRDTPVDLNAAVAEIWFRAALAKALPRDDGPDEPQAEGDAA